MSNPNLPHDEDEPVVTKTESVISFPPTQPAEPEYQFLATSGRTERTKSKPIFERALNFVGVRSKTRQESGTQILPPKVKKSKEKQKMLEKQMSLAKDSKDAYQKFEQSISNQRRERTQTLKRRNTKAQNGKSGSHNMNDTESNGEDLREVDKIIAQRSKNMAQTLVAGYHPPLMEEDDEDGSDGPIEFANVQNDDDHRDPRKSRHGAISNVFEFLEKQQLKRSPRESMMPQRAPETDMGGNDPHIETFAAPDSSDDEEDVEFQRVPTRKSNLQRHQTTPIELTPSDLSVNNIPSRSFTIQYSVIKQNQMEPGIKLDFFIDEQQFREMADLQVILAISRDSIQFSFSDVKELRLKFSIQRGFKKVQKDTTIREVAQDLRPNQREVEALIIISNQKKKTSTTQLAPASIGTSSLELEEFKRSIVKDILDRLQLQKQQEREKAEKQRQQYELKMKKMEEDYTKKIDDVRLGFKQLQVNYLRIESENEDLWSKLEETTQEMAKLKREFRTQSIQSKNTTAASSSTIQKAFWDSADLGSSELLAPTTMRKSQSHQSKENQLANKSRINLRSEIEKAALEIFQRSSVQQDIVNIQKQESGSGDSPDLVFFYSEPLVDQLLDEKTQKMKYVSTGSESLATDSEYKQLLEILKSTNREFAIQKEAINFESLKKMVSQKPKIIHISCHGDFADDKKQFYLQFEGMGNGVADKFYESRLMELLGSERDHGILLAFVSACHSEEIGNVLRKCNIPLVIAVNSESQIADEICLIFSRHLYLQLLQGVSISKAFEEAQRTCRASPVSCKSCCCAHSHTDACKWKKFAEKNGYEKAHELHSGKCGCDLPNSMHKTTCEVYQSFMTFLRDYKDPDEEAKKEPPKSIWALDDDFDENFLVSYDQQETDNVMCCCKKDIPHDESIKFILKCEEASKDLVIFKNRSRGKVTELEQKQLQNKVSQILDTSLLIGKNLEVQKCVEMLTSSDSQKLILISGPMGSGKQVVAQKAVNYCIERNFFKDGAFEIDGGQRKSTQGLITAVFSSLRMNLNSIEDFLDLVQQNSIVFILNNCEEILEHDKENFCNTIKTILDRTTGVKIILTLIEESDFSIPGKRFHKTVQIKPLNKYYAAKMLKAYDYDDTFFPLTDDVELQKHELFSLTLQPQQIQEIYMLLQSDYTLDQIADLLKEQQKSLEDKRASSIANQERSFNVQVVLYSHMEQRFPDEKTLLHVLAQAPCGMTLRDIKDLVSHQPYLFGMWERFLDSLLYEVDPTIYAPKQDDDTFFAYDSVSAYHEQKQSRTLMTMGSIRMERDHGFKVILKQHNEDLQESVFLLKKSVVSFVNDHVLEKNRYFVFFQYIRFFSKLGRQYVRNLKLTKSRDFDLNLLSAEIDQGLWEKPSYNTLSAVTFENDIENEDVDNVGTRFEVNDGNFQEIFNSKLLTKLFKSRMKTFPQVKQFLDELFITYVTILLMQNKYKEALDSIDIAVKICRDLDMSFTSSKLMLISMSIEIKHKRLFNLQKQISDGLDIFQQSLNDLGKAESYYLEAVWRIQEFKMTYPDEAVDNGTFLTLSQSAHTPTYGFNDMHQEEMNDVFDTLLKPNSSGKAQLAKKIQKALENALRLFEERNQELGVARCILLNATFHFESMSGAERSVKVKQFLQDLEFSSIVFEKYLYLNHHTRCLIYVALIYEDNKEFQQAKQYIQVALSQAKAIQDYDLLKTASEILSHIQLNIQINSNNLIVTLASCPLVEIDAEGKLHELSQDYISNSHIEKYQMLMPLQTLGKQVNIKFGNLNLATLTNMREYGCRILIINCKYSADKNSECLYIEGEDGELVKMSADDLYDHMKPQEGGLNIDVVFINMHNSERIGQVFRDLGVPHVFTFQQTEEMRERSMKKNQLICRNTFGQKQYVMNKTMVEALFQKNFCIEMIQRLISQNSFFRAFSTTKKLLQTLYEPEQVEQITWIQISKESSGDKLFDEKSLDERKMLLPGPVDDQSSSQGPTNMDYKMGPLIGRRRELYDMLQKIKDTSIHILSVSGDKGIGKSRLVKELGVFANRLGIIPDGNYFLNFQDVQSQKDIEKVFNEAGIEHMLKSDNLEDDEESDDGFEKERSHSKDTVARKKDQTKREKKILMIYDNIDGIITNKSVFKWHIQQLIKKFPGITFIFTQQKKCRMAFQNTFKYTLQPLSELVSLELVRLYSLRKITAEDFGEKAVNDFAAFLESNPTYQEQEAFISDRLAENSNFKQCVGNPNLLLTLASLMRARLLKDIEVRQEGAASTAPSPMKTVSVQAQQLPQAESTPGRGRRMTLKQEIQSMKGKGSSVIKQMQQQIFKSFSQIGCSSNHDKSSQQNTPDEGNLLQQRRRTAVRKDGDSSTPSQSPQLTRLGLADQRMYQTTNEGAPKSSFRRLPRNMDEEDSVSENEEVEIKRVKPLPKNSQSSLVRSSDLGEEEIIMMDSPEVNSLIQGHKHSSQKSVSSRVGQLEKSFEKTDSPMVLGGKRKELTHSGFSNPASNPSASAFSGYELNHKLGNSLGEKGIQNILSEIQGAKEGGSRQTMMDNIPKFNDPNSYNYLKKYSTKETMRFHQLRQRFHTKKVVNDQTSGNLSSYDSSYLGLHPPKIEKFTGKSQIQILGLFLLRKDDDEFTEVDLLKHIDYRHFDMLRHTDTQVFGSDLQADLSENSKSFIEMKDKVMSKFRELTCEIIRAYKSDRVSVSSKGAQLYDILGNELNSVSAGGGGASSQHNPFDGPSRDDNSNSFRTRVFSKESIQSPFFFDSALSNKQENLPSVPVEPLKVVMIIPKADKPSSSKEADIPERTSSVNAQLDTMDLNALRQSIMNPGNFGKIIEEESEDATPDLRKTDGALLEPPRLVGKYKKSKKMLLNQQQSVIPEALGEDEENQSSRNHSKNDPNSLEAQSISQQELDDVALNLQKKVSYQTGRSSSTQNQVSSPSKGSTREHSALLRLNSSRKTVMFANDDESEESEIERLPATPDNMQSSLKFMNLGQKNRQTEIISSYDRLGIRRDSDSEDSHEGAESDKKSDNSGKRMFEINMLKFHGSNRVNTMK